MPTRLPAKPRSDQAMTAAARQLMAVQASYASSGTPLCQAALCGARDFVEWAHYPANDCTDAHSGFEFYYHAHTRDEMSADEHGHFHVFRRDANKAGKFFHVIGISLDAKGLPIKLFTTNTWVTGESMVTADRVANAAQQFGVQAHGRVAPIARWLTALMQLYAAEIAELARLRAVIAEAAPPDAAQIDPMIPTVSSAAAPPCIRSISCPTIFVTSGGATARTWLSSSSICSGDG